jgi:tetratricopeptide (TPR) repeat protein
MSSGGDGLLVNITAQYRNRAVSLSDYDRMRSFLRDLDYTPDPDDPGIWKSMGNNFFRLKKFDLALQCYANAVEINHYYTDALYNIALTFRMLGRNDDAAKIFAYINTIKIKKLDGNYGNNGYFLSKFKKEPGKIRYRIIDHKIGIPVWLYGVAAVFILYGAYSQRLVGGIMWAFLVLGIGYFVTKIRIKSKKGFKIRFLSLLSVISSHNYGYAGIFSRSSGINKK